MVKVTEKNNSSKGRRLCVKDRIKIHTLHKMGFGISAIQKKIGCANRTVYFWINEQNLYKSLMGIRKKHKKHIIKFRTSKPHKKTHVIPHRTKKYKHLTDIIIKLYKEGNTYKEIRKILLDKYNMKLCEASISKRISKEVKKEVKEMKKIAKINK